MMISFLRSLRMAFLLALLLPPAPPAAAAGEAPKTIPDVELLDQQGRKLRFYSDLVEGRVVAIQFIFTSCRLSCPLLGVQFGKLQQLIGDALERDVRLISLSVDPLTDRPEKLAAWAEKFKARPGWTQLTGERREVETLLKALGAYTADKNAHTSFVLLIDAENRRWQRLEGLASAEAIAAEIARLRGAE